MEIEAVDGNLDNGKWNTTREKYRENRRPNGPFTEPGTVTIEGKVLKVNGALRSAVPFVVKIKFKYKGSGSDVKHCKVQWNEKWAEDFQVWDKRANKMRTVMRKGEWGNIFEILPKHMPDVSGDPLTQDYAWVEYKKKQPGLRCPGEYEFESFDAPFKIMDPKTMRPMGSQILDIQIVAESGCKGDSECKNDSHTYNCGVTIGPWPGSDLKHYMTCKKS